MEPDATANTNTDHRPVTGASRAKLKNAIRKQGRNQQCEEEEEEEEERKWLELNPKRNFQDYLKTMIAQEHGSLIAQYQA